MTKTKYRILTEPVGHAYKEAIDTIAPLAASLSFSQQKGLVFNSKCTAFLEKIRDDLVEVSEQSEWPGTRLLNTTAPVCRYRLSPTLTAIVKDSVGGLYDWAYPDFPEDLAFYRADGSVLLGSCSHERFAFLELCDDEFLVLNSVLAIREFEQN